MNCPLLVAGTPRLFFGASDSKPLLPQTPYSATLACSLHLGLLLEKWVTVPSRLTALFRLHEQV